MSSSKYDFDGLDNDVQDEVHEYEQEEDNFTREEEVTDNKTTVKTTVISLKGSELTTGEELPEEVSARLTSPPQTEDISVFSCYTCKVANVKLQPIITEDQKRAYSCFRCISNEILDIHFQEFLSNNEAYIGVFHNYLDKTKA